MHMLPQCQKEEIIVEERETDPTHHHHPPPKTNPCQSPQTGAESERMMMMDGRGMDDRDVGTLLGWLLLSIDDQGK